jgi:PKD repeat protein
MIVSASHAFGQNCPNLPFCKFTYSIASDGYTVNFAGEIGCNDGLALYWDFDDGAYSDAFNLYPSHIYTEAGTYIVTMKVTNPCGIKYTHKETIVIAPGIPSVLWVNLVGPTIAAECQEVTYTANIVGGTPPYSFKWSLDEYYCSQCSNEQCSASGSTMFTTGPSISAKFKESGIFSSNVYVTVTDGRGMSEVKSLAVKVRAKLDLDFYVNSSGPSSCGTPYIVNSLIGFSPKIVPFSSLEYPINYHWDFGDGATFLDNFDGGGFTTHSYTASGVMKVVLTVTDANGSMQVTKNINVCNPNDPGTPPPPNSGCYLTYLASGAPSAPSVIMSYSDPGLPHSLTLSQYYYGPNPDPACNNNGNIDRRWKLTFLDILYPPASGGVSASLDDEVVLDILSNSSNPVLFRKTENPSEFRLPANYPNDIALFLNSACDFTTTYGDKKYWGCMRVQAETIVTNGTPYTCCNNISDCMVYIKPDKMSLEALNITGQCQDYYIEPELKGGGWRKDVLGKFHYKDYTWSATDRQGNDLDIFQFPNGDKSKAKINLNHPYFKNFESGSFVSFNIEIKINDYDNKTWVFYETVYLNPFRITLKNKYYRCPGTSSTFDNEDFLATGGTENYTYLWSGGLTGTAPVFTAPMSGSNTYTVTVTDGGNCTLTASTTITARAINTIAPANVKSCETNGERSIGPSLADLGGSGEFSYDWSAANPAHLAFLNKRNVLNPIVKGLMGTAVYTLTITDLYGGCTKTAVVTVVSYPNTVNLSLPSTYSTCHGDELKLQVGLLSSPKGLPSGYTASWTYPTFPVSAPMLSTLNGGLIITGIAAHNVGLFPFKVRVIEAETGCYADATTNVRIQDQWRYSGYESVVKSAILGTSVELWPGYGVSTPINVIYSPNALGTNSTVTWTGGNPVSITNYLGVPNNGLFIPTPENPFLMMKITHSSGCSKEFRTRRYILSSAKPELSAEIDQYVVCRGSGQTCVKVRLDPHLIGLPPTYMPQKVTVGGINGSNTDLYLSSTSGVYEGVGCFNNNISGVSGERSLNIWLYDPSDQLYSIRWLAEPIELKYFLQDGKPYEENYVGCMINPVRNKQSVIVARSCEPSMINPPNNFVYGYTYNGMGLVTAKDFIHLVSDNDVTFAPLANTTRSMHFYIDPCLTQGLIEPPIERNIITTLQENPLAFDLSIVPNPFHSEITVRFHFDELLPQSVDLELYDVTGRKISVLHKWIGLERGDYSEKINVDYLPPGLYTYVLRLSNGKQISKQSIKI